MNTSPLSASRLDALNCPRKYYNSYHLGLEPDVELSELLHSGSVGHTALHVWYSTDKIDHGALTAAYEAWGDFVPRETTETGDPNPYKYLSWPHMKAVLQRYFDHNRDNTSLTPSAIGNYESEQLITVTLPNGIEFAGRIDHPVVDQSGHLYIFDHKFTTGNMGPAFFNCHRVSNQLRGYCAMTEAITGEAPEGAGINGIYMGNQKRKPESAHQEKHWSFPDWSLAEFYDNVEEAQEEIDWRTENGEWPQRANRNNCGYCPFMQVCKANPKTRQTILDSEYRKKERQS